MRLVVATVVLLLAAGCTGSPDPAPTDGATPSAAPTATETVTPPPSSASPAPVAQPTPSGPSPIPVLVTATHPAGVTVTATAVTVTPEGVAVEVTVDNAASEDAILVNGPEQTYAVDDTGARLELVAPDDNPELRVGVDQELNGTLAFAGRTGDGATSLTLRFNYRGERPLNASGGPGIVSLQLADVPLTALQDADGSGPEVVVGEVEVQRTAEHPSGVTVRVTRVRTDAEGGVYLRWIVSNSSSDTAVLANTASSTYLRDDGGRRLQLRPPSDNPSLELAPGRELTGEVAFVGPLAPGVTSVRLYVNADPDSDRLLSPSGGGGVVSFLLEDLTAPS